MSRALLALAMLAGALAPVPAPAFDAADSFQKGAILLSLQAGGGRVNQAIQAHPHEIWFLEFLPRVTYVPWDPFGSGWLRGTVEVGGELWLQWFREPVETTAKGVKLGARYDFLGFGRVVPYVEFLLGVGAKNFRPAEDPSPVTFATEVGAGLAYMLTPSVALSAGYRFQHLSNAGLDRRNRGFNSDTGVVGVSVFFP